MTSTETLTSEQIRDRVVALVQDRRGADVVVLDVRALVDYMDFLVLATARSERQNRAIADHVRQEMKHHRLLPLSRAGYEGGSWICLDYVDVVLHTFTPDTRTHYDLELLWADAERSEVPELAPDSSGGE
jgi:ribosome-associated protein